MNFLDVLKKRRSIRQFQNVEIPDEIINNIIELASLAPSAGNLQAFKVVISKLDLSGYGSPINLVICASPDESAMKYGDRGRDLYSIQDATIFGAYIQLVVIEFGLSSVWVGAFNEDKIRKILKIDDRLRPIAIIPIGYSAAEKSNQRNRKKLKEIVW